MTKEFRKVAGAIGLPYHNLQREAVYKLWRESNTKIPKLDMVQRAHCASMQGALLKDCCIMCGLKVEVMAFKGTGVCSELCRKDRDRDHGGRKATIEAPQGGPK